MKKILSSLLILGLLLTQLPVQTAHAEGEEETVQTETETVQETEMHPVLLDTDDVSTTDFLIYSASACVMDVDTGAVLYYKNKDDKRYPASTTKVLTGLVLIENSSLDDVVTFDDSCWEGVNYYDDMNIGMLYGERLKMEAVLHAILISSANEVCNGAASYLSGSVEKFVKLMNKRAKEIGCTNTHFTNPNGLHNKKHYTTAYDLAMISRVAFQNETFRKITGTTEYTVRKTNKRKKGFTLYHKHQMLIPWADYYRDYCVGGKTGYTDEADNTLVTYAEKNGHTLVAVVMKNADGHIYPDTIDCLEYCFDNYEQLATEMAYTIPTANPNYRSDMAEEEASEISGEVQELHLKDPVLNNGDHDYFDEIMNDVVDFAAKNMKIAVPIIALAFIMLTLILVWLKSILTRAHHRHKYKKLQKKRKNNKKK